MNQIFLFGGTDNNLYIMEMLKGRRTTGLITHDGLLQAYLFLYWCCSAVNAELSNNQGE